MLQLIFPAYFVSELASSFVDNVFRDKVAEPAIGSVVYCDLAFGIAEHSGIYVGNNEIIHYNKHGIVERVSPEEFIDGTTAISIYVGCLGNRPVGSRDIAKNAEALERNQHSYDYNVILNNCHQFSEMCVTGKESSATFLKFLKWTCESRMGVDCWRVWDRTATRATLDITPSEENLAQLDAAIKQQERIVDECDALVAKKTREWSDHCDTQPTTIFFFESRMESWRKKYDSLKDEMDSRQRVADEAERKLRELKTAREDMRTAL